MKKFVLIFIVGVIFAWQSFVGSA
ncbi:MAG: cytochrome c-550, partial [Cyanobacteria bacterium J149]